ncbi:MerR family transcriptional regulator [Nocardioides sp. NPDC057767]|uniref:MerR family transcriptional regulator n=1 Tax=unclassified Nocardioides TaxID=2615069 RepID=UPI00366AF7B0
MRIGELAAAVGVSTRTVRYYHQVGLLPEPKRSASGYRVYGMRDLVLLSHARRLVALGLGLDEVRQVLADEEGRDLGEIVASMDAALAVQQERLAAQRRRLAELQERVRDGCLALDDLPDPELVEFFTRIEAAGATGAMARLDRDVLAFVPGADASRWIAPMLPLLGDEHYTRRLVQMYDEFDRLADVDPDDPAVITLVGRILDLLPRESLRALSEHDLVGVGGEFVIDAIVEELAPGQAAAARLLIERTRASNTVTQEEKEE